MLADYTPVPTLAVADLARAREYYEGTLGMPTAEETPGGVFYQAGGGRFFVYPSGFAGTNKATAVSFQVPAGDFDALVSELREKGVSFLSFDLPDGANWADGVADFGDGMRGVWFTDPDDNILNVDAVPG